MTLPHSLSLPKFSEWGEFRLPLWQLQILWGFHFKYELCSKQCINISGVLSSLCLCPHWAASLPQLSAPSVAFGKHCWSFRWIIYHFFPFLLSLQCRSHAPSRAVSLSAPCFGECLVVNAGSSPQPAQSPVLGSSGALSAIPALCQQQWGSTGISDWAEWSSVNK